MLEVKATRWFELCCNDTIVPSFSSPCPSSNTNKCDIPFFIDFLRYVNISNEFFSLEAQLRIVIYFNNPFSGIKQEEDLWRSVNDKDQAEEGKSRAIWNETFKILISGSGFRFFPGAKLRYFFLAPAPAKKAGFGQLRLRNSQVYIRNITTLFISSI